VPSHLRVRPIRRRKEGDLSAIKKRRISPTPREEKEIGCRGAGEGCDSGERLPLRGEKKTIAKLPIKKVRPEGEDKRKGSKGGHVESAE